MEVKKITENRKYIKTKAGRHDYNFEKFKESWVNNYKHKKKEIPKRMLSSSRALASLATILRQNYFNEAIIRPVLPYANKT